MIFYDSSDEIEIRLPFYRSFSTFWKIYLVVFALKIFIHWPGLRVNLSHLWLKIKSHIQPQPKYKTREFQNLMRKRLLRDISNLGIVT